MKTVTEITQWLNTEQHVKCVLADISEVGVSPSSNFYFSSTAYDSDGIVYDACITGGLSFSESLNVDGNPSLGFGSLEIVNIGGINDSYLNYVWNKRPIKIYLGDPTWPKSDFVLIFDGLIQELTAPNEGSLSFSLFDKLQRLNDPISERTLTTLGEERTAAGLPAYSETGLNNLLPLLFGEAFNIQPLLIDKGGSTGLGQTYMVSDTLIQGAIEVRDNGVPITVTESSSTGTFTLLTAPIGTITCSAQGSAQGRLTYTNTVAGIIEYLVNRHGNPVNRFSYPSEISFGDFNNTSAVGIYFNDRTNIIDACNQLAKSVNANLICPSIVVTDDVVSASKLRLVEIKAPTSVGVSYQWQKNGSNINGATSSTYAVSKADYVNSTSNIYTCIISGIIDGSTSTRTDRITIPLLQNGSSAIQVLNSNENIRFTAEETGYNNINFANGSSIITVYIGDQQLDYVAPGSTLGGSPNSFSATIETGPVPRIPNQGPGLSNDFVGGSVTLNNGTGIGKIFTVPAPYAMSAETAYTTVTITVRNAANVASTITTVINYSLARKSLNPGSATDYYQPATFDITNTGEAFYKSASGIVTPDIVTLSTAFSGITPKYYLNDDNMILNSLSIQEMFPVKPSIKLAYCKNYTVQTTVAGGVNPQSRFDEPYLIATAENTNTQTLQTLYKDSGTIAEEETLLLVKSEADAEAQKRLELWQKQRYLVTADYLPQLIFVQLGDIVRIKSARFGLTTNELPDGKLGMVYSVARNWTTGIVTIGVLV